MNDFNYVSKLPPEEWEWFEDGEHFEFGEKEIFMTTTYNGIKYDCTAYVDCDGGISIDEESIDMVSKPKSRIDILKCSVWAIIIWGTYLIWKTIITLNINKIGD